MTAAPVSETFDSAVVPAPPRVVVVAPSYNHATGLALVLRELASHQLPVIVINDGATDDTETVLRRWLDTSDSSTSRWVVRHPANQGKAAALRSGFAEATRLGFTHAAAIDTDGQHDVADLAHLAQCCAQHPEALIVGARIRAGSDAPMLSRVGRVLSNGLVWLQSGVSVTDSQSGMRVYPLAQTKAIAGRASRYGFETEVLVLAGWCGIPVIEKPIRCIYRVPGGRTSHFRVWNDTIASIAMHARLLGRALFLGHAMIDAHGEQRTGTIPRRLGNWLSPRRIARMATGDADSRERLAASVGVGLLMATLPIYGIKTVVCLWLAKRFRLHPLPVLTISSLSTPPLGLAFVALSICVGGLLIRGQLPEIDAASLRQAGQWSSVNARITEWLVGSVIAGMALGAIGYALMRAALRRPSRQPPPPADPPRREDR